MRFPLASLSASIQGVITTIPLLVVLKQRVTTLLAVLVPVKVTVAASTYARILHPKFLKSSRKYFKYWPYFTGSNAVSCGKLWGLGVEKSVENRASYVGAYFKFLVNSSDGFSSLWKTSKNSLKKKFLGQNKREFRPEYTRETMNFP